MANDEGRDHRPQQPARREPEREEDGREFAMVRDRIEKFDPVRWKKGIDRKRQFNELPPRRGDPGRLVVEDLGGAIGRFLPDGDRPAQVAPSRKPPDKGSFGFVGVFADVTAQSSFVRGTLALRFDGNKLGSVSRQSLRMFRWDDRERGYRLVTASGVGEGADYAWGRITQPGTYALIGLNVDPLVLSTITMLSAAKRSLRLVQPAARRAIVERICLVILCPSESIQFEADEVLTRLLDIEGLGPGPYPPTGWRPPRAGRRGTICDQCLGMVDLWPAFVPEEELLPPRGPVGPPPCADTGWQSVGPGNLAGCVVDVAIDPADNNCLYAAASDGGLWRLDSVSGYPTTTWRPLTDQNDSLVTTACAVAASDSRVVYLADGLGRLLRSDNRGDTWRVTSAVDLGRVRRIVVHPRDAESLFVASNTGLWGSTTGGATWDSNPGQTALLDGDVTDAVMDPGDSSILYVGVKGVGVRKSYTFGRSFSTVLPWSSATSPSSQMIKLATGRLGDDSNRTVAAKLAEEVFVNRRGGRPPGTSGGGPWTSLGNWGGSGYGDWCHVVAVDPFDNNVILAGAMELYRTSTGDSAFTRVASYYAPHEDQQRLIFDSTQRDVAYLTNDGGVYRSSDGGITWYSPVRAAEVAARRDLNDGLVTAQFYRVGVSGDHAVGNLYHSGIIATDRLSSSRWSGIEGHAWEFAHVFGDPRRSQYFYVFGRTLGRRRYPGTGTGDFIVTWGNFAPTAIAVDMRADSNTILAASSGPVMLWRTLDGSVDAPVWAAETVPDLGGDTIVSIQFAPSNPGMAYILTASGKVWRKPDVNGGDAWEYRGQWAVGGARQLAVNSLHSDRLYAITNNQVALSSLGGSDWAPIPGTAPHILPDSELNSVVEYPGAGDIVIVAADIGVFISYDEGIEWHPFDAGLPNAEVLQIYWRGPFLYAVTHGRGLWRRHPCL